MEKERLSQKENIKIELENLTQVRDSNSSIDRNLLKCSKGKRVDKSFFDTPNFSGKEKIFEKKNIEDEGFVFKRKAAKPRQPAEREWGGNQEFSGVFATFAEYKKHVQTEEITPSYLIGKFKNGEYFIDKKYVDELIAVDKIVEKKEDGEYIAVAYCGIFNFTFQLSVKRYKNRSGEIYRYSELKLIENYKEINGAKKLTTKLATYMALETPSYLHDVKSKFHIHSKAEAKDTQFENKTIANLTLAKLASQYTMMEMQTVRRRTNDYKYLTEMFKILKTTTRGKILLDKYAEVAKANGLKIKNAKDHSKLRYILDKLLNNAISNKVLDGEIVNSITKCRENYVVDVENYSQSKFKELKIPEPEQEQEEEKKSSVPASQHTSSPAYSSGGGFGGGNSGSGGGSGGSSRGNSDSSNHSTIQVDDYDYTKFPEINPPSPGPASAPPMPEHNWQGANGKSDGQAEPKIEEVIGKTAFVGGAAIIGGVVGGGVGAVIGAAAASAAIGAAEAMEDQEDEVEMNTGEVASIGEGIEIENGFFRDDTPIKTQHNNQKDGPVPEF